MSNYGFRREAAWEGERDARQVLQTVEEEAGAGNFTAARKSMVNKRSQKKVTDYYAEKEEDPDRINDFGIEHHTMSAGKIEDFYEDSISHETASTKIERVPGIRKYCQAGRIREEETRPRGTRRLSTGIKEKEGNVGPSDRNPRNSRQRWR